MRQEGQETSKLGFAEGGDFPSGLKSKEVTALSCTIGGPSGLPPGNPRSSDTAGGDRPKWFEKPQTGIRRSGRSFHLSPPMRFARSFRLAAERGLRLRAGSPGFPRRDRRGGLEGGTAFASAFSQLELMLLTALLSGPTGRESIAQG